MPGPSQQDESIGRVICSTNGYGNWTAHLEEGAPITVSHSQRGKKQFLTMIAVLVEPKVYVLQVENTDFVVEVDEDGDIHLARYFPNKSLTTDQTGE